MSTIANNMVAPPDNFSTTLSSGINNSDLSIPLNSVAGLATEGVGVVFSKDANGDVVASSIEFVHWTGISGSNLTLSDIGDRGLTGSASGAQAHASGSYFEVWVTSFYYASARTAFLVEHFQDGTHKGPVQESYSPDVAGTATLDLAVSNRHSIQMPAGNITIALDNETTGQFFLVEITQDSVGSRSATWFSTIRWVDGSAPTLSGANKRDTFAFIVTGAGTYDGFVVGQNI